MKRTHAFSFLLAIGTVLISPRVTLADEPERAAIATLGDRKVDMSAAASAKRDEAIKALLPIVNVAKGPRKAELVFRLAELYWEKSRSLYADEMLRADTAYVEWERGGEVGPAPVVDDFVTASKAYARNAISLYGRVLEIDPSYARNDEVLFFLAQSAKDSGNETAASEHYGRLIRQFPKSAYVPAAHLRLGESAFAKNDLNAAEAAYKKAYAFGDGITKRYALYKLAWCDFNRDENRAAIDKLKRVVADRKQGARAAHLASESLRDLTRFFAAADDVDGAVDYFEANASDPMKRMSEVAAFFDERGQWASSNRIRRAILARHGHDARAADEHVGLIESLAKLDDFPAIIREAELLAGRTVPAEQDGARLFAVAGDVYRIAVKSSGKDAYRAASGLYAAHLTLHPTQVPESANFFLAEASMALEKFATAARAYDRVADAGEGHYRVPAALGAVLAIEKLAGRSTKRFVSACDRYVRLAPDAPDAIEVAYRAAQELEAASPKEAQDRFLELAKANPNASLADAGARRTIDRLLSAEDWASASRMAGRFAEVLPKGSQTAQFLTRTIEAGRYKSLQAKEEKARSLDGAEKDLALSEVADELVAFAEQFRASPFADEALLSAAILRSTLGRVDLAIEASSLLAERYPESEHRAQNYLLYAELHERIADLATAARMYAQFAKDFPDHPKTADALINAGVHFTAVGDLEAARRAYLIYVERFSAEPDAPKANLALCETYRAMKAADCFGRLVAKWKNADEVLIVVAMGKQAEAFADAKRTKRATNTRRAIVANWGTAAEAVKRNPRVLNVVGKAAFELAELRYERFRKMPLRLNQRSVKRKMEALADLVCAPASMDCRSPGRYVSILAYGDPESAVAALTRIGDAYQTTLEAFEQAPIPGGLTDEQRIAYRALLAERTFGQARRAIEAYELAVSKSQELGVYDEWVIRANAQLAKLDEASRPSAPERPVDNVDELLEAPMRNAEK